MTQKKTSQAEQIRQHLASFPLDTQFTVSAIRDALPSVSKRAAEQTIYALNKQGKIICVRKGSSRGGPAVYKVPKEKPSQSATGYVPQSQSQAMPLGLPLDKVGEAILAYTQLLKRQIYDQEERIQKLRTRLNEYVAEKKNFRKLLDEQDEQIKVLADKVRSISGKTFPMNEVARVLRQGKLESNESSIEPLNGLMQQQEVAEEERKDEAKER